MALFFILIGLAFLMGVTYLFYWIPKKAGYPKVGIYLSIIVGLLISTFTFFTAFEDELFSKSDADELLAQQKIVLIDKFEIISNESFSSIGDYHHILKLSISSQDKERIISEIQHSDNFNLDKEVSSYSGDREDYYNGPKRVKNYETTDRFVRELFAPMGKGYAPIWRKIEIDKVKNELTFRDTDE